MELYSQPSRTASRIRRRPRRSTAALSEIFHRYSQELTTSVMDPSQLQVGQPLYDNTGKEFLVVENEPEKGNTVLMPADQQGAQVPEGVTSVDDMSIQTEYSVQPAEGATAARSAVIKKLKEEDKDSSKPAKEQVWGLYTHDGKKLLGRHPSEEAARQQEEAIKSKGGRRSAGWADLADPYFELGRDTTQKREDWPDLNEWERNREDDWIRVPEGKPRRFDPSHEPNQELKTKGPDLSFNKEESGIWEQEPGAPEDPPPVVPSFGQSQDMTNLDQRSRTSMIEDEKWRKLIDTWIDMGPGKAKRYPGRSTEKPREASHMDISPWMGEGDRVQTPKEEEALLRIGEDGYGEIMQSIQAMVDCGYGTIDVILNIGELYPRDIGERVLAEARKKGIL